MTHKSKAAEFEQDVYDITITGRHLDVTEAMKSYAIDKISKIDRFNNRLLEINVIMDIQKLTHHVEIILKIDNHKMAVSGESSDMYSSIDKAVSRLKEKMRRYKERVRDHHAAGHAQIAMGIQVYPVNEELEQVNREIEAENNQQFGKNFSRQIVKEESISLRTFSTDEAISKMELFDENFIIFRSEEDRKLKVIYRREDGNLGIMAPE